MPTVTRKGQVTIPKKVRDAMGLVPGSHVEFVIEPNRVVLRKGIPPEVFDRWRGYLRGKLLADSLDEVMEMLRGERLPPDGEPR
ncbi:MAG TPA: AbrB/MazE/SpoVT family DNA-binding domain-containing protein [Chloroflexota bacterium]|nr:AbrB/MazE/SpoVT family DNA-binding domain-containing protein [Chloroflexota bacterium]